MNPPTSLCHSGAGNSPGCAESPAGAFITHSAHLPALDSDGAAVLPAPRRVVTFEIHGKPFGKQRPRATKFGRMYTPGATVKFETAVRQIGLENFPAPIVGPVRVEIIATFEVPKSVSKAERAARLHRPHTMKPDLDNCQKAILDGLNRVAFADDGQVAEILARKVWGLVAKTIVHIEALS